VLHQTGHRTAVACGGPRDGDTVIEPAGNVAGVSLDVRPADHVDDELVDAFAWLIPQLSSSSPPPTAAELAEIVDNPHSVLFIARVDGSIVGSLTLAFYRIPTGLKAWIEDVVVDASARGHGVGEALNAAAIDESRRRGAKNVSLTSRPSREAANRLYQRLGFHPYDTNLYRYSL
jgi:ribosomal protein S18 acetylase RimI-like enzyme